MVKLLQIFPNVVFELLPTVLPLFSAGVEAEKGFGANPTIRGKAGLSFHLAIIRVVPSESSDSWVIRCFFP